MLHAHAKLATRAIHSRSSELDQLMRMPSSFGLTRRDAMRASIMTLGVNACSNVFNSMAVLLVGWVGESWREW